MSKNASLSAMASLSTELAIKKIESLTLGLFLDSESKEARRLEIQKQIAEILFQKLSHFKGTGLKILQCLSLDEDLIPPAYTQKFQNAYSQVDPVSRPVIHRMFKSEFGKKPTDLFETFDYQSIAAASIGQVHRARLFCGTDVAVKIQYPNVKENLAFDLKVIRNFSTLISHPLLKNTLEELSMRLAEEVNFTNELENIWHFYSSSQVRIPKSYPDLSTSKILTMEFIAGTPLHLVEREKVQDSHFQDIFNFFILHLHQHHAIHGDPHPGNFLVSPDSVGLVDFGSVKGNLSSEVVELFFCFLKENPQKPRILELYNALGADFKEKECNNFYDEIFVTFYRVCQQIFNQKACDFSDKRPIIREMRRVLLVQSKNPALQKFSSDFTLLHKSIQALLLMFAKFGCRINTHIHF